MVKKTYMLDTCICSFIMREQPIKLIKKLQEISSQNRIVVSAITYAEMRYGTIGKKASPKHKVLVDEFVQRIDAVLPWDFSAVDAATKVKAELMSLGKPIGNNDTAIAGHAIAENCILVSNNTREFSRVKDITLEDWV